MVDAEGFNLRVIGDAHGKYKRYRELIRNVPFSIQVGDMGVGFMALVGGEPKLLQNPPHSAMSKGRHLFIRGNHDNPEVCKRQEFWIPDGTFFSEESIFCVGGAGSTDRAYRTEGWDWWADEELSIAELDEIVDRYVEAKPRIMITHDCPMGIANDYLMQFRREKYNVGERTRQALEVMLFHHKPELWLFGHWHHTYRTTRGPTTFQCLDELDWADLKVTDEKIEVTIGDGDGGSYVIE